MQYAEVHTHRTGGTITRRRRGPLVFRFEFAVVNAAEEIICRINNGKGFAVVNVVSVVSISTLFCFFNHLLFSLSEAITKQF